MASTQLERPHAALTGRPVGVNVSRNGRRSIALHLQADSAGQMTWRWGDAGTLAEQPR